MNKQDLIESWSMFHHEHGRISVDRMICAPKLRAEFVGSLKPNATEFEEKQILWQLLGLGREKNFQNNKNDSATVTKGVTAIGHLAFN